MQVLAPIVIFVYNRPSHTRRMMDALEKAQLAEQSEIFIFSDGAKSAADINSVNHVRSIICEPRRFKKINIIEREKNYGLANNIIAAVTQVVNEYGKVIVLEDDLEIAEHGLQYFNEALNLYRNEEQVMEISGYMYPAESVSSLPESFFFRVANSWGWATWDRAWKHFDKDINKLTENFSKEDIKNFSIDHTENFWKQVQELKAGKINSWAIRWYLSIFNQKGLVLYPRESMIQNIGTDGSGTHSDADAVYKVRLATKPVGQFPSIIEENPEAYKVIQYFYKNRKGNLMQRGLRFAKKMWLKRK